MKTRRGAALIAVMWIVLLAGLVLLGVNRAAGVNLAMAHTELAMVQARWLARGGVEQGMAILDDDSTSVDSSLDWWYDDPASFEEVELTTGTFSVTAPADVRAPRTPRYGLLDLSSRLDLNTASEQQLTALPQVDPSHVDAIIDWRDSDENSRPGGAERGYYQRLEFPYEIRNGPFQTHAELLLVKGIDAKIFYGQDTNGNGVVDAGEKEGDPALRGGLASWTAVHAYERNEDPATGLPRININSVDPNTLKERLKFTDALAMAVLQHRGQRGQFNNLMQLLEVQPRPQGPVAPIAPGGGADEQVGRITLEWLAKNLDRLTTKDDERLPAKININTAPRQVLMTLPGMTAEAADAVLAFRDSSKGPVESLADLIETNTVDQGVFRNIAELVTVRSGVFRVTSVGRAGPEGAIRCTVTAVIDRNATPPILYWHESE